MSKVRDRLKGHVVWEGKWYQQFYLGMIFSDGRYYDRDENRRWYSQGILPNGLLDDDIRMETEAGKGSEPL